jgi:hypothetical protein
MARLNANPSRTELKFGKQINLVENEYPGRVLIMGRSLGGKAIQAYALTGRRPSSKNRVFAL